MKFLVYTRAIVPGSKLDNSKRINYFAEPFDISIDDIYDALDRFDDCKEKLQEYLYKKASYLLPPTDKVIFYDVTNFYYEIEEENDLCAYGVEKNIDLILLLLLDYLWIVIVFQLNTLHIEVI